jgi:hypothetical protein
MTKLVTIFVNPLQIEYYDQFRLLELNLYSRLRPKQFSKIELESLFE